MDILKFFQKHITNPLDDPQHLVVLGAPPGGVHRAPAVDQGQPVPRPRQLPRLVEPVGGCVVEEALLGYRLRLEPPGHHELVALVGADAEKVPVLLGLVHLFG